MKCRLPEWLYIFNKILSSSASLFIGYQTVQWIWGSLWFLLTLAAAAKDLNASHERSHSPLGFGGAVHLGDWAGSVQWIYAH